jgi:hypothetical protein
MKTIDEVSLGNSKIIDDIQGIKWLSVAFWLT